MPNLLVEIGTEELPLASLDVVYADLVPLLRNKLAENRLSHGEILLEATPRRIAFFVEALTAKQESRMLEIAGPSHDKAYGADGRPTQALEGFLKSKKAVLKDVRIVEKPKGKFVMVRKKETGKPAASVLRGLIPEILSSLSFPKWMRWDSSGVRFPRPVRWLLCLLDKQPVPFQFGSLKAGAVTYGHRFLAPKAIKIRQADWKEYRAALKKAHVVLKLNGRESLIRKDLSGRFGQRNPDDELVHMTAQLVEEPFLIQGGFLKTYLELPAEVLASCMKKNQKIFACRERGSRLSNKFVAVMNGRRKGLPRIISEYENVLEARLRDARYFYDADTQAPLESKLQSLEQITYLGKLGTMLDKTKRLEQLAGLFAAFLGRNDIRDDLVRAARLSKIDLMTQMVYEFPDLQGVMGREYAVEGGDKESVAGALGTQYLPKNLGQDYSELSREISPLGAMFGILDRVDLLVGAFGIGLEPSGSQDPFALRRAAGSVVKLVRAFGFHFSLGELVDAAAAQYGNSIENDTVKVKTKLIQFLKERAIFEVQAKPGTRRYEIFEAVLRSSFDDMADVFDRFQHLSRVYEEDVDAFIRTAKVVERTSNILKGIGAKLEPINPELFQNPLEGELFRLLEAKSGEIEESLKRRDYALATVLFGNVFYNPIHDFFDQVMVNVEDTAVRSNRQALMKRINNLYAGSLADLSVLSKID
ncbi:MAG: glycine--tRNA ligase subunit beta [Candidatus Omnitrophota bacterium]|nr:glycine--tRNA ligase subunit beta [Candidatus Omnitrophota bacterium]